MVTTGESVSVDALTHTPSPTHTQENTRSQTARWSSAGSTRAFHKVEAASRVCREIEEKGFGRNPTTLRPQQNVIPIQSPLLSFYSPRREGHYSRSHHLYYLSFRTEIHLDFLSIECST